MDFDKIIKERHSVRNYSKNKKVDYKKVIAIIEAGNKAPLAGNIYSLKYIVVSDKDEINQLAEASQQDFFKDVNFIIVVCSDKTTLERNYYERALMYSKQQAGAAIENMLLKTTELGMASCWIGAFSDITVKRILGIPEHIDVEAILPIGFEVGKNKQKVKPDLDRVVFFDKWNNKLMSPRRMPLGSQT